MNTVQVGDPATPLHASKCCSAPSSEGWVCTEAIGHPGDHIACGITEVLAVWS